MHVEFSGCKMCLNHSPGDQNPLPFHRSTPFLLHCPTEVWYSKPERKSIGGVEGCSVCVCFIIICIPGETVSKASHKYHSWYLCLFNLCSYSLYRKQDH